ncbi:hypothetical protein [Acinetobacter variabilis]|uniref:hypothetical protein n=1 Tax=Acinetobacter variabilis TaxID=70346 RepID=UPI003AF7D612
MKQFSKVLILIMMGFYGTSTIAADAIPLEAKAAAEAQKAALEYSENQKSDSDSDGFVAQRFEMQSAPN